MKRAIKCLRNKARILLICLIDFISNSKYCGFYSDSSTKRKWKILLLSHSIEKGMSIPNKRLNFGEEKALDLYKQLKNYNGIDEYAIKEGYSILSCYIDYRKRNGLSDLGIIIPPEIKKIQAGSYKVKREELLYDYKKFVELCDVRHSVREYADKFVEFNDILKAVDIAKKSPSACNRQMIKIYTTDDINANRELSKIIPGNNGFKDQTARYLFLVSDRNAFDFYEIDQWYLNGGIFVAYLQLALTSLNIGSCIYQWPKIKKLEKKAKKILNIPKNEIIVSVISVGYYKETFEVLSSTRKKSEDFIVKI